MNIRLSQSNVCLAKGQLMSLAGAKGSRIVCHSGNVWITQDGDPRDVVLSRGEAFTLDRAAPTIVSALAPAVLAVQPPAPRRRRSFAPIFGGRVLWSYAH